MVATETGPDFFGLCYRVPAYQGVMAARFAEDVETPEVGSAPASAPQSGVTVIESDQASLARSPIGDLFEMGTG